MAFVGYCEIMLSNIKVYTTDKYWTHIFTDLGAIISDPPKDADVVFDNLNLDAPISLTDLKRVILDKIENRDIIQRIFGRDVVLPNLQHRLVVCLDKNPNITMRDLKKMLGILPNVSTHAVENAVYQLRKVYGRDFIQNINGKYKIGNL